MGVDSFNAIAKHIDISIPQYQLTNLFYYSLGYSTPNDELMNNKIRQVSKILGLPVIEAWSNFPTDLVPPRLFPSHTYWMCAAITAFNKGLSKYYIASSYPDDSFNDLFKNDCSHYEGLLLSSISTASMKFIIDGQYLPRYEKMEIVSNLEITSDYLIPCWSGNLKQNCNWCSKCMRTMIDLDAHNKLDQYANCFDVNTYRKANKYYMMYLLKNKNEEFFKDAYTHFEKSIDNIEQLKRESENLFKKYKENDNWAIMAAADDGVPEAQVAYAKECKRLGKNELALGYVKKASEHDSKYLYRYIDYLISIGGEKGISIAFDIIQKNNLHDEQSLTYLIKIATITHDNLLIDKTTDEYSKIEDLSFNKTYAEALIGIKKHDLLLNYCQRWHKNSAQAALYYGRMLRDGTGIKKDIVLAEKILREAVTKSPSYIDDLVKLLITKGDIFSLKDAWSLAYNSATWGNPFSMMRISQMYLNGVYIEKDVDKSYYWMKKASEKLPWASINLCEILRVKGTEESYAEMIGILKPLVEKGNEHAIIRLSKAYRDGLGVEQSYETATDLLRRISKKSTWAALDLSDLLLKINTPESIAESIKILENLASKNNEQAQQRLKNINKCDLQIKTRARLISSGH